MLKNKLLQIKNIKVYTPTHLKTDIKGYWLENNCIHENNIIIQSVNTLQFQRIKHLLYSEGEQAIFSIQNNKAYIETQEGLKTLTKKHSIKYDGIGARIKDFCNLYGGCTVFKNKNLIVSWSK